MSSSKPTSETSAVSSGITKLPFRRIGAGSCGSVYASARIGQACALKRADGASLRSLESDYSMHKHLLESFAKTNEIFTACLSIPACHALILTDDEDWWTDERIQRFPEAARQERAKILISERIPSFPETVMRHLLDGFCLPSIHDKILPSLPTEHCMIRAYLGRRRPRHTSSRFRGFSLRNYPLCVDDMERWGLPVEEYAESMADTLAWILWEASCDAEDVEYVLAPPREQHKETPYTSSTIGSHTLWLLDFDCVRFMTNDEEGLKKAAEAFWRNDPYYPRPGGKDERDQKLWGVFRKRFLEASDSILRKRGQESVELAESLMDKIENTARVRE